MGVGHYENFPVASVLLPAALRAPVAAIYRFARSADDFADEGDDPPALRLERLDAYRAELACLAAGERPRTPLFVELGEIVRIHQLPLQLFHDLLDAFTQDVTKHRYANYGELQAYCARSANPVGRLLLHLFGHTTPEALARSDSICSALQLVNFWQDAAIDYTRGRIYLPRDEMQRFGVTEAHLAERRCDASWRALIGFESARARRMLNHGAPLGRELPGRLGWEIRLTVHGGLRILDKIVAAGCDVFRRRPRLRWYDWPLLLARAA